MKVTEKNIRIADAIVKTLIKEECTISEAKKTPEREREIKEGVDCLMQHLKTFHEQACLKQIADFGEPCVTCPFIETCKCDWQGKIFAPWNPTEIKLKSCTQQE